MNKLNISLIEKTPILAEGLKGILNSEPLIEFVQSINTYSSLAPEKWRQPADLLIAHVEQETADAMMSGLSLLKKQAPELRAIAYFETVSPKKLKRLLISGFEGILLKQDSVCEFMQIIEAVIRGKKSCISHCAKELVLNYSLGMEPQKQELTYREQEVLQLIVEEYTTKEIAKKLFISSCTVETHRLNIIQKLGVRNTAGLVREAMRMDLY